MAKHEVGLKIGQQIELGNVDIELPVRVDGKSLCRMAISKGGVDWIPSPNRTAGYRMTWSQFAELMKTQGTPRK